MNKIALVFALVMALLSPLYAVDIIDTNIYGAHGIPGEPAVIINRFEAGPHNISGSDLTAGSAMSVTTNIADTSLAFGGSGFYLFTFGSINREIYIDGSSVLQGGQGGTVTIDGELVADVNASGGRGLSAILCELFATNSSFYGGDGGTITATDLTKELDSEGGAGIGLSGGASGAIILDLTNVYAEGGQGGSITTSGTLEGSSANGGNGAYIFSSTSNNSIVNSELVGGDGGFFNNSQGIATANGGAGLFATDITGSLVISNSVLTGGVNTNNLEQAAGLEMQGSTVDLLGATLNGGLLFSGTGTNTISIVGTTININGTNVVQSTTITGGVRQTGGTVNVNAWDDEHFEDTLISDGTMNFIGQMFNLGGTFELQAETATANFNVGLTVQNGGTLILGLSTVTASEYGRLTVTGPANLNGGTLDIVLLDGFSLAYGDSFDLFNWDGGVIGEFETITTSALTGDLEWDTSELYTTGTLTVSGIEPGDYFITASAGSHGSITPSGNVNALPGTNITFTITPDPYYQTADVYTNGVPLGLTGATAYTWNSVNADGTLNVTFAERTTTNNIPEWWLAQYGWTNDFEQAALADTDGDGYTAGEEFVLGFNPTDPLSTLGFSAQSINGACRLNFLTVAGRTYIVEYSNDLTSGGWSEYFSFDGFGGEVNLNDSAPATKRFYRVKVDRL